MARTHLANSDPLLRADFPHLTPIASYEQRFGARAARVAFIESIRQIAANDSSLPLVEDAVAPHSIGTSARDPSEPSIESFRIEASFPRHRRATDRERNIISLRRDAPEIALFPAHAAASVVSPNSTRAPEPARQRSNTSRQLVEAASASELPEKFDIALSFAGPDRARAEELAILLRDAGYSVFYDHFFIEALWGKDLVPAFDEIFRKKSRYCVIFISSAYSNSIWSLHEIRSALARALAERGREYILPIKIDDIDLDGLRPTIGYLPIKLGIPRIAELLMKKLGAKQM